MALAAFANPLAEVVATGNMVLNYLLNGNYSSSLAPPYTSGLANWGDFSNLGPGFVSSATTPPTVIVPAGIGPLTNYGLTLSQLPDGSYGPSINAVGLIPDFLAQPFPILTQVINNQLGYLNNALQAVNAVVGAGVNALWAPVQLAVTVSALILSGNIALVPAAVTEIVGGVVTGFQVALGTVVDSASTIVGNLIAKASAVAATIVAEAPLLLEAVQGQFGLVVNSVQNTIENVAGELAAGDIEGTWNAAVRGLLGPSGIPGTLVNLTLGAGIQISPDIAPTLAAPLGTPGTLVPSSRVLVEVTGQALTGALKQTAPVPVTASSVRAAAATSAPAAVEAAPAADATAGDNSAAAESTTAAPAASAAAADDSSTSDAPKASKAGAARAGR